jgi:GT2 family glycosyltransferase
MCRLLPRISVVVPNFNGELYLAECLNSVISQNYPVLELIVTDGGSVDNSVSIIESYGHAVSRFTSEPDGGQSDAINKGIRMATGDIVAYLNSDDVLEPASLGTVASFFQSNPDVQWLAGGCRVFGDGVDTWVLRPEGWQTLSDTVTPWARPQRYVFPQSGACFMKRSLVESLGQFDETLHYSMDMEYYARAAFAGVSMHIVSDVLAGWRIQPNSKTVRRGIAFAGRKDEVQILRKFVDRLPHSERVRAKSEIRSESLNALLREANFWSREGNRVRSALLLGQMLVGSPSSVWRRPWLGGVRLVLFGEKG